MSPLRLLLSALLVICINPQLHGQASIVLTAEDSAHVIVVTLQVLTDSLGTPSTSERPIWLNVRHIPHGSSGQRRPLTLSERQWAEIRATFPTARPVPPGESPFLCPPGVEMSLPGRGCPIQDGGTVIELGLVSVEPDSATTFGMVMSASAPDRPVTFAQGIAMVLERIERSWRLRRATGRAIT